MKAALPYFADQLSAALAGLEGMLADGRPFLLGQAVSVADLAAYHPFWFIVSRLGTPVPPLAGCARVLTWMERIKAIGHGTPSELESGEAIEIAREASPVAASSTHTAGSSFPSEPAYPSEPVARKPGDKVTVTPDDTGREPTAGELVSESARHIVIRRTDERARTVHVHFPKLGFVAAAGR